ncbi:MAG: hypothetical protein K2M04_00645 [Muribaculaceae bacterium]|nr:hypothetical protein [Muribaculaceae bacterium]
MSNLGPGNHRAWRGMLALAALLTLLVAFSLFSSRLLPHCTGSDAPPYLSDSIVRLDSIVRERAKADSIARAERRNFRRASRPKKSAAPRRSSRKSAATADTFPPDSPHNHPISSH